MDFSFSLSSILFVSNESVGESPEVFRDGISYFLYLPHKILLIFQELPDESSGISQEKRNVQTFLYNIPIQNENLDNCQ